MDWYTVPVADQNGIILTYTVTYKALPGGSPNSAVVSAPITQASLTGLKKYRNYSITVFASSAKGNGPTSQTIIVTTDQDSKLSILPSNLIASLQELLFATINYYRRILYVHLLKSRLSLIVRVNVVLNTTVFLDSD